MAIDPAKRTAVIAGEAVDLTAREFDLLLQLFVQGLLVDGQLHLFLGKPDPQKNFPDVPRQIQAQALPVPLREGGFLTGQVAAAAPFSSQFEQLGSSHLQLGVTGSAEFPGTGQVFPLQTELGIRASARLPRQGFIGLDGQVGRQQVGIGAQHPGQDLFQGQQPIGPRRHRAGEGKEQKDQAECVPEAELFHVRHPTLAGGFSHGIFSPAPHIG